MKGLHAKLHLQGDGLYEDEDNVITENCEERGTSESQSRCKPPAQILLMEMVLWHSGKHLG